MPLSPRPDDFDERRRHLRGMSDAELHAYFWELAGRIVEPLVEEARTHTTPAIERSVLMRMGLSSLGTKALVGRLSDEGLLGHGAGRIVLEIADAHGVTPREAGEALLDGRWWEEVRR